MTFEEMPAFSDKTVIREYLLGKDTLRLDLNRLLVDYLNNFNVLDLPYYFNSPISEKTLAPLDRKMAILLNGRTPEQKLNLLLSFVQRGFGYKDDLSQFGHEKYMFADEAFFYPYIDCDDRAVLFAHLVRRYTGMEVVGLDYPDHVATAVKLPYSISGDSIIFQNEKYFLCDPTYIGAKVGMAMKKGVYSVIQIGK
jgi:hypothetical protein